MENCRRLRQRNFTCPFCARRLGALKVADDNCSALTLRWLSVQLAADQVCGLLTPPQRSYWLRARQAKADDTEAVAIRSGGDAVIGDSKSKIYYPLSCELLKSVVETNRVKFPIVRKMPRRAGYGRAKDCQ